MELKLFHTNDIHSHLAIYDKIIRYLNDKRIQFPNSIYVDLGDHVDRSHPYTEGTLGKANVALLNEAGVDVATFGNNEGITLNHDDFNHLYDDAHFKVTCCNLYDLDGHLPHHVQSHVIEERQGIRIGFIGATAEFTPFYEALGWDVREPLELIEREVAKIKHSCDVIVVLSHLGMFADRRIAEEIAHIDIILGAHTHHHFDAGEWVNGVLIGAAGRYGQYIGEMTLTFDGRKLIEKSATLIDTDILTDQVDHYFESGRESLSEVLFEKELSLPRKLYSASYATALLAHELRAFLDADCALVNSGLIVTGYEGSEITKYDLHQMLPHPINPVKIFLTGRELKEIIAMSMKHEQRDEIVKGFGFRGDIFGMYVWDNVGMITSERQYYVDGKVIDNQQEYTLATLDMYTFGRFFPQFVHSKKEYIMPEFLRDIMQQAIEKI